MASLFNDLIMKMNYVKFLVIAVLVMGCTEKTGIVHRENGWYHMVDSSKDSLSMEPIITVKDFVGLKLDTDYFGKYVINGQISRHKLDKWITATEKAIGKRIAFVFCDSIITCPQVNSRIESGAFQIASVFDKKLPEIYKQLVKEKSDSLEAIFKGWEKDDLYYTLSPEQQDSIRMALDYWDAKAWVDLSTQ